MPVDLRLRSLLFAPAVRPEMLRKLPGTGADGVVIDCEDATPAGAKAEGRANAREIAPRIRGQGALVFVRVNAVASPWFEDDLRQGLCDGLAGIVIPKLDTLGLAGGGLGFASMNASAVPAHTKIVR